VLAARARWDLALPAFHLAHRPTQISPAPKATARSQSPCGPAAQNHHYGMPLTDSQQIMITVHIGGIVRDPGSPVGNGR
jgi:hypothetical protein